ncbi:MAG: hypothetical protein ACJ764_05240 [Solirubrobacteraceae bacterium]
MPYIPAGRRRGVSIVAALTAGLLVIAQPAIAKAPPKPPPSHSSNSSSGDMSSAIQSYLDSTNIDSSSCADPQLSQPFADGWSDSAYYALAPGQDDSSFTGNHWFLWNGANITSTTLLNGNPGSVLDLPGGSLAVSPPMCLAYNYPTARMMVRNMAGNSGVSTYVVYFQGSSYQVKDGGNANGNGSGSGKAWGLSGQISLQPSSDPGWQLARFVLYNPGGASSDAQIYNFYVDPYAKR